VRFQLIQPVFVFKAMGLVKALLPNRLLLGWRALKHSLHLPGP
jgi:hypothetical protein